MGRRAIGAPVASCAHGHLHMMKHLDTKLSAFLRRTQRLYGMNGGWSLRAQLGKNGMKHGQDMMLSHAHPALPRTKRGMK